MTDRPVSPPGAELQGDWIDQALATDAGEHASAYVSDDGFTARVMRRLPVAGALPAWRRPAVAALWLCAAALLTAMLPDATQEVARGAFRLFAARPFSLSTIALALVAVGVATSMFAAIALRRD